MLVAADAKLVREGCGGTDEMENIEERLAYSVMDQ
jgi:hypothetical protein